MDTTNEPKMGRFKKSWYLTKGAWSALKLDKELLALPIIGGVAGIAIVIIASMIAATNPNDIFYTMVPLSDNSFRLQPTLLGVVVTAVIGLLLATIGSFVSGAITHGALQRFKGNDPNIKSSVAAARRRLGSLTAFAMFSYTIGYILSTIAERIPFIGGQIVAWLASAAWNVASFFALPIIVSSDKAISPIAATKQSVGMIKKVWGESLIASATIGLVGFVVFVIYFVLGGLLLAAGASLALPDAALFSLAIVAFIGILVLSLLFEVLGSFVKAAMYHYATTGESPVHFDKQLLRQAFTHKKAKKAFRA